MREETEWDKDTQRQVVGLQGQEKLQVEEWRRLAMEREAWGRECDEWILQAYTDGGCVGAGTKTGKGYYGWVIAGMGEKVVHLHRPAAAPPSTSCHAKRQQAEGLLSLSCSTPLSVVCMSRSLSCLRHIAPPILHPPRTNAP